jgi:OmpA-OmpF porin, OOP family
MHEDSAVVSTHSVVRAWRRVDPPAWPFAWRGLLPVVLLFGVGAWGLTRFASNTIEASVRDHLEAALQARGDQWVHVAVSGQQVVLSGEAPSDPAGDHALAAAAATTCPTWLGPMICAISVKGEFTRAAAMPVWPSLRASVEGGVLQVSGALPDEASRGRFEALAQAQVRPPAITAVKTQWTVSGKAGPDRWDRLGSRVLAVAGRCQRGWAELKDDVFSADCTVSADAAAALAADARATTTVGRVGEVTIEAAVAEVSPASVAACEGGLAKLLEGSRIEFAVGSAALLPTSSPLIARIAKVAADCPGTLRIEGHTDAVGSLESNTVLSRQRAEAVRAALLHLGLSPKRLVAEGFGPAKPLASNDSPDGRARNRRIEFHVVRPQEKQP